MARIKTFFGPDQPPGFYKRKRAPKKKAATYDESTEKGRMLALAQAAGKEQSRREKVMNSKGYQRLLKHMAFDRKHKSYDISQAKDMTLPKKSQYRKSKPMWKVFKEEPFDEYRSRHRRTGGRAKL